MKQDNIWTINLDRYQRPRLTIPLSKTEVLQDILSLAGIAASFIALFFCPPGISLVPLLMMLLVSVLIFGLITYARRFPNLYNYAVRITAENAEYQYSQARVFLGFFKTGIIWFFFGWQLLIELKASFVYIIAWSAMAIVLMSIGIIYNVIISVRSK